MKILWTEEAKVSFDNILYYINSRFSTKEVTTFYYTVEKTLILLQNDPYIYQKSKNNTLKSIKIHKLTTLFFEINKLKNEIILISFHQNRQSSYSF